MSSRQLSTGMSSHGMLSGSGSRPTSALDSKQLTPVFSFGANIVESNASLEKPHSKETSSRGREFKSVSLRQPVRGFLGFRLVHGLRELG